jgi:hypothetical protein
MSITILPDDTAAAIVVDTAAEAVAVLSKLPTYPLVPAPNVGTTTVPPWSGLAAPEAPVEDIDSLPEEEPRCRPWKDDETRRMQRWVNEGLSVADAAERLGRTPSSVRNKLIWLEKRQRELLHLTTPGADQ